ncbi:MAG: hypothetical protein H6667_25515 [Ardenticatenaceae bacterium]|nr:hypothetical protein [Ardenticatenaceae bacterium]
MTVNRAQWLPLHVAAQHFGYRHRESLRRRLRQLRRQGLVQDFGWPPEEYTHTQDNEAAPLTLMWPNPQTALLRSDAPRSFLQAKRGRRRSR